MPLRAVAPRRAPPPGRTAAVAAIAPSSLVARRARPLSLLARRRARPTRARRHRRASRRSRFLDRRNHVKNGRGKVPCPLFTCVIEANTVTGARPRVSNHCLHCLQHPTENTPRNTVHTLPGSQRLTQGRAPTSVGRPFFAGWCGHHGTCTWSGCGEGSTVQALQGGKSATGGGMRMYMYQPSRSPQPSSLMPHQSIISVSALLLP